MDGRVNFQGKLPGLNASLRSADVFPVVASLPPEGGREATTGNTFALRRLPAWVQTSALMSSRSEKWWNDHFSQDCVTERSHFLVFRDGKGPRCDVTEQTERRNWSQAHSVTCWPPDNVLAQPTIERLSIAFTTKSKREFVARDQVSPLLVVYCSLGTLRSNDATATRTSLKKWIFVLSVFIAIIPSTHLLCQL